MILRQYKILPMSITEFQLEFKLKSTLQLLDEYYYYLHQNAENHHHNGFTIDEWYELQVRAFYGT